MNDRSSDKIVYDYMLDIHKHIFEQLKFAETKLNILLGINLALLGFIVSVYTNKSGSSLMPIAICILLFLSLCFVLKGLFPRVSNKEIVSPSQVASGNIFFYGYLATMDSAKIINHVKRRIGINKLENEQLLYDLANQIQMLSTITNNKHINSRRSTICILVFITLFIFYVIFDRLRICG